jgi:DtxR family Mn-dependent transcriptional regulator
MKSAETLTRAVQDYLKAVYALAGEEGRASTNDLAQELGVSPASVTGMIQKLAAQDPALLDYQKHHGVALTKQGLNAALRIIRHHRLIEMFLHEALGFSWDEVHEEAERLEHVISERLEERIAESLGDPTHDPHGDPIPTRDLKIPPSLNIRLSEMRPDQRAVVRRVRDSDPQLLRYLSNLGVTPGAEILARDYSAFDENLRIEIVGGKDEIVLGSRVTRQVYVELM